MRGRSLLWTVAVLLLVSISARAQSNTLRGKVRSTSGITVNNAIVELKAGGGGMIGQTVTRNDGDFAFSNLPSGEYEVEVTVAGFETAVQMTRFNTPAPMNFAEVVNIEVIIRPRADAILAAPGTSFTQDVPKPARTFFEKGMSRLREGKSDEGIAMLREAIEAFNDYFNAHFQLGRELFRLNKNNEALEEFERARQINERQDAVYFMFGMVMLRQQKFALAQRAFQEASSINGNSPASHFYRGQALVELALRTADETQRIADLSDAEKELKRAWELSNGRLSSVYLQRARICERRGNREAAARELEEYLKAEPEAKNASAIRAAITRLRGPAKPEPPADKKPPRS
ncbi:MAG: carboxypeptidase regulatory-like domain-containing protein [Acidobacteriota bacterium]